MAFQFNESPSSRSSVDSDSASKTLVYVASGTTDDEYVKSFARAAIPGVITTVNGILYRGEIRVDPEGHSLWTVTAPFNRRKQQTGSYTWSFDTTGATVRITTAKQHVASFPADASNPDPHKGTIGVTKNGDIEGAEIVIPALKLQVQFRHPLAQVTLPYAKKLARLTGTTNTAPWLDGNFAAGELLFLGAQGSDGSESESDLTYNFAASENAGGLTFGDIAGVVKKGHEYAWVEYEDSVTGGGEAGTKAKRVHVERVYGETNFGSEFGWG